jgi:hypothetical protein
VRLPATGLRGTVSSVRRRLYAATHDEKLFLAGIQYGSRYAAGGLRLAWTVMGRRATELERSEVRRAAGEAIGDGRQFHAGVNGR